MKYFRETRFLMAETAHERLPSSTAEVVFIGRSNVGKSSLLNALTNNRKLARISKTPGATRGIIVFEVRPGRWVIDMPGYGYAVAAERTREYWPEMIGAYLSERENMKCAYVLIDTGVGPSTYDQALIVWLQKKGIPYRLVATKMDKIGRQRHEAQLQKIAAALGGQPTDILLVSAKEGDGISILQADVRKNLETTL